MSCCKPRKKYSWGATILSVTLAHINWVLLCQSGFTVPIWVTCAPKMLTFNREFSEEIKMCQTHCWVIQPCRKFLEQSHSPQGSALCTSQHLKLFNIFIILFSINTGRSLIHTLNTSSHQHWIVLCFLLQPAFLFRLQWTWLNRCLPCLLENSRVT